MNGTLRPDLTQSTAQLFEYFENLKPNRVFARIEFVKFKFRNMPTIKELGLQEGQQVFCFGVEKTTPSYGTHGGLSLKDAMVDPKTDVKFALVKLIKRGELSDLLEIIGTNSFDWGGIDHRDFPDVVKTKNITSIHNLYPNYIADGVGPKIPTELSIGVVATNRPFENRSNLVTPEGEIVGELVVNNQGMSMSWNLEFLERQREE